MTSKKESTKGRVKVGKLQLNKETVEELGDSDLKQVKGGVATTGEGCDCTVAPPPPTPLCEPKSRPRICPNT